MPSCSSSSARVGAVPLLLAAATLSSCALGLDFGTLSNECLPPRFDLPTADTFCSGELVEGTTYLPPGQQVDGGFTLYPLVTTRDDYVATASMGFSEDDRSCVVAAPGLDVGRLEGDGSITPLGAISGRTLGLTFVLAGCPDGLTDVWPVEIQILDTVPYVHVAASFAQAGLLELWVDAGASQPVFYHHIGGAQTAPTRRECLLGACVTSVGQPCVIDSQCHPDSYCDDGLCRELADCTVNLQCGPDGSGQECATRRGRCALRCDEDEDCPHPYPCILGLCGGGGCSGEVPCLATDAVCVEGACLSRCGTANACPDGDACFQTVDEQLVCSTSPGGRIGGCYSDSNCALGAAYGFTRTPPNALLSFSLPGILLGTLDNLRLGVYIPTWVSPYLTPPAPTTQLAPGTYTDLVYVEEIGAIYIALATGFIVRYDWDDVTLSPVLDSAEYTTTYPVDLQGGTRLLGLRQIGGYLVTVEAVNGTFAEATPHYARALVLDADQGSDLQPLFEGVLELGDTIQASFGPLPGNEDVWVFGLDREHGGEIVFYSMRDPHEPALIGSLRTGDVDQGEAQFVSVTDAGIFVTDTTGVTPYAIQLEGAE